MSVSLLSHDCHETDIIFVFLSISIPVYFAVHIFLNTIKSIMQYLFIRENEDDNCHYMLNVNYAFCQISFLSITEFSSR